MLGEHPIDVVLLATVRPRWFGYLSIFALKKSTAVFSVRRSSSASSRYWRVSAIVRSASSSSCSFWSARSRP